MSLAHKKKTGPANSFFGRKHTEETRAKMRAAQARRFARDGVKPVAPEQPSLFEALQDERR